MKAIFMSPLPDTSRVYLLYIQISAERKERENTEGDFPLAEQL